MLLTWDLFLKNTHIIDLRFISEEYLHFWLGMYFWGILARLNQYDRMNKTEIFEHDRLNDNDNPYLLNMTKK